MMSPIRLDGDQLIATRRIDASPAVVWEALTTPDHLAAFWGGDHATVRPGSVTVDLQVGGIFEIVMVSTEGHERPLKFRYDVIDPPGRLVLVEPRTGITTEITLSPSDGGTTVVVHQRRLPPELRTDQARTGLAGILDRLNDVCLTSG